jgi:glycosyltransferase involved in cell wall biosynthesis
VNATASIAVVIRTKNSGSTLEHCLSSIQRQSVQVAEIVVVDSGSTDSTLSIAKKYSCKIIRYPEGDSYNYSKALNIGIAAVQQGNVLLLSSHVELQHTDSIKWMQYFLSTKDWLKAVSLGRTNKRLLQTSPLAFNDLKWSVITKVDFKGQGMFNYCALIRKVDWIQHPFDTTMAACEDQAWIYHYMRTENAAAVVLKYPFVYYNNPYYNLQKDVRDHLIIAQRVHPYLGSLPFIKEKYKSSLRQLRRLNWKVAKNDMLLATHLLKHKLFPTSIEHFESIYHKGLR